MGEEKKRKKRELVRRASGCGVALCAS